MARWTKWFTPVALMPNERVQLRKRESLRLRGLGWAALFCSFLALLVFSLCVGVAARGWQESVDLAVRTALILLLIFALPALLVLYAAWLDNRYVLSAQKLCRRQGIFGRLERWLRLPFNQSAAPASDSLDCVQIWRVSVESAPWPASWFDFGNVVVSTRNQARALVMQHMPHPHLVAGEIMRYARRASGSGGAGEGELITRRYRASLAWLSLRTAPGLLLLWASVMAWFGLRLTAWLGAGTLWAAFKYLVPIWLVFAAGGVISFLRWYYCVYLITDRRVVSRKGLLTVNQVDLRLEEVVSASVTQAGLRRYIDVGTVQVNTAGHSGNVTMLNISEPGLARQIILDTQERLRQQRQQVEFGEIRGRLVRALRL